MSAPTVGVLALQGAFVAHERALRQLGVTTQQVRTPAHLAEVQALVMPGGESTTMSKLLVTSGIFDALQTRLADGLSVFGTCAGMILLAAEVLDGLPDQRSFAAIDIGVRRNGYGRQVDSFEADIAVRGLREPVRAVFIRAPAIVAYGPTVAVLATVPGRDAAVVVAVRQDKILATAFHPELTNDPRWHRLFLAIVAGDARAAH